MPKIINHTTCQRCKKTFIIEALQENPEGIGKICIDLVACKKQEQDNKKTQPSNPYPKPTR